MYYRDAIAQYIPESIQETNDKQLMLQWIGAYPETILTRQNEFAHMTSSALVFDPQFRQILMIHHNIYHSWAWMGGHADGEDDLFVTAIREATEESGISNLTPVASHPTGLDILTVKGHFKHSKWVSAHLHLSLCYSFIADPTQPLRSKPDENSGAQWIPLDRLNEYVSEPDMLPIYERIIRRTKALLV